MRHVFVPYSYPLREPDLAPKSNILIDNNGRACLAGLGLLVMIPDELIDVSPNSPQWPSGTQWSAPEVLRGGPPTKETDIYSFAMIMIEVCHERSTACGAFWLTVVLPNSGIHWNNSVR